MIFLQNSMFFILPKLSNSRFFQVSRFFGHPATRINQIIIWGFLHWSSTERFQPLRNSQTFSITRLKSLPNVTDSRTETFHRFKAPVCVACFVQLHTDCFDLWPTKCLQTADRLLQSHTPSHNPRVELATHNAAGSPEN